ncbi:MAG TPA: 2-oxoacid:acceptor oxidoreductase subunit alpha [Burkholderiales bacterium]
MFCTPFQQIASMHQPALRSVSVALAGSGGAGVMTAGNVLLEAAAIAGYYGLMTRTSGPQIRGGEAAAMLRVATFPTDGQDDGFQVLAAIDWQNVTRFAAEIPLGPSSLILGDPAAGAPPELFLKTGARYAPVPLKALAAQVAGGWPNMIALGVLAGVMGLSIESLDAAVRKSLKKNVDAGLGAAHLGFSQAAAIGGFQLEPPPPRGERWLVSGNEAAGYGALRGGVRFVAAYPITPATELLEYLSPALTKIGGTLVQAEDELASINMALGASYGGVPSLTATSGPGLSLMIESLGLGVAAEVPVVVVDVMRTGPSTGIATKSEQGDLNIALYGLHGDAPHIVVAPNSVGDCLSATQWAVELAESLQVPAIVLSDQYFGQARAIVDALHAETSTVERLRASAPEGDGAAPYKRYAITPSGVSPMAIPGRPGITYTADGLEHNERGLPSSQAADHLAQMDKRARKISQLDPGDAWASIEGQGDVALLTFGSCTAPAREALARAHAEGVDVRLVSLRLLAPAQPERLKRALEGVKRVIVLEQNHSGQFLRHLRSEYDLPREVKSLRRPGPLPFRPEEIYKEIIQP